MLEYLKIAQDLEMFGIGMTLVSRPHNFEMFEPLPLCPYLFEDVIQASAYRLLPGGERQGQRRPPRSRLPRHQLLQRRGQVQPQGLLPLVRNRQDQRHQDRVCGELHIKWQR